MIEDGYPHVPTAEEIEAQRSAMESHARAQGWSVTRDEHGQIVISTPGPISLLENTKPRRDPGCGNASFYPQPLTRPLLIGESLIGLWTHPCAHGPEHACQACSTGGAPRELRSGDPMERRSSTLHPMEGTP